MEARLARFKLRQRQRQSWIELCDCS